MINFENGKTPLSAEILNKLQSDLLQTVFPIGSTYITQEDTNPNTILGFGAWERLKGKVCLGLDEDDTDFNIIGNTGGEKEHTLTVNEMPTHNHTIDGITTVGDRTAYSAIGGSTGATGTITGVQNTGGGQPHNNMPPYEIVGYMWIRRA